MDGKWKLIFFFFFFVQVSTAGMTFSLLVVSIVFFLKVRVLEGLYFIILRLLITFSNTSSL